MTLALVEAVRAACAQALPPQRPLALHEPLLGENEQRHVRACLESGWVSTAGPFVDRFEAELARITGARHVIATVNGTAALHAALLAAGVRPGDEVLVPALTFVATANAVSYCGAIPHFVESSLLTLGVDAAALEHYLATQAKRAGGAINRATGRPIRALVVMHTFGHPAEMESLCALARAWDLALIEDAAESLGSTYRERHTGTFGAVGTLSFNGNKTVTTGGGGAILTQSDAIHACARHLATTARVEAGWNFIHDRVGYNYRMPSLNAALGLAQLERLPRLVAAKQALAARYERAFAPIAGVRFFTPGKDARSNHWLNTLILDPEHARSRDDVVSGLNADGIRARPAWAPMHRLPMYATCPRMPLPIAEQLAEGIVNLPSSPQLVTPC